MPRQSLRSPPLDAVEDKAVRQALQWFVDYIVGSPVLGADFQFFDMSFESAVTALSVRHNLPFIPQDIIQTYVSGPTINVTWLYDQFTDKDIFLTTDGACRVRFLAGKLS